MFRVVIGKETIECKDTEELRKEFGSKCEYTPDTQGDILISHPLNPRVQIRAVWVD